MNSILEKDMKRYFSGGVPVFQKYYRKAQETSFKPLKLFYKWKFKVAKTKKLIELSVDTKIGAGLYIGHPHCITVNPAVVIGENCNIHKGVTIGQENRGMRKGTPVIGNSVWIGINSTLVGNIHIGDDVLIAPNSFVNCNVPDHSIVIVNPCIIRSKENATEGYINRKV